MKKLILSLFVISFTFGCKSENPEKNEVDIIQKAQLIHLRTTTLDTHNDIDIKNFTDSLNYSMDTDTQVNLPKMIKGALDVSWLIVYTGQGDLTPQGYKKAGENAQEKFDAINRFTQKYAPNKIALARTAADVDLSLIHI